MDKKKLVQGAKLFGAWVVAAVLFAMGGFLFLLWYAFRRWDIVTDLGFGWIASLAKTVHEPYGGWTPFHEGLWIILLASALSVLWTGAFVVRMIWNRHKDPDEWD